MYDLKNGIRHDKHHQGDVELIVSHACGVLHVVARGRVENLGIANVAAIQKGQEINGRAEGQDPEILLQDEGRFGLVVPEGDLRCGSVLLPRSKSVRNDGTGERTSMPLLSGLRIRHHHQTVRSPCSDPPFYVCLHFRFKDTLERLESQRAHWKRGGTMILQKPRGTAPESFFSLFSQHVFLTSERCVWCYPGRGRGR